jgi:sodium/potassium-transporting ATPase subunit alpha
MLLSKCAYAVNSNGQAGPLSQAERNRLETIKDRWSGEGKRVILMAQKVVSSDWIKAGVDERCALQAAQNGLTLVGLVGLIDPPVCPKPLQVRYIANSCSETKSRV